MRSLVSLTLPLVLLAAVVSVPVHAQSSDGPLLIRCQHGVTRAAIAFERSRREMLDRCVRRVLRCSAALTTEATAATDPCLAAVAARCRAHADVNDRHAARLLGSLARCTLPRGGSPGVSLEGIFGDDGLAFAGLATLCPATQLTPVEMSECQRRVLACSADAAFMTAVPRGAALLARLGLPFDDPGCVRAALCGNDELDGDEECDDGVDNSDTTPDACRTTCVEAFCGDGVIDADEDCDDGNDVDGDGCDTDCTLSEGACGNGVVDAAEECDAGLANSDTAPDACRTDCTQPVCGDGVTDPGNGEQCEPPQTLLCTGNCTLRLQVPVGPLAPSTLAAATAAGDLARCQAVISRDAGRFSSRTTALALRCVAKVMRCVLGIPEERDPDGDRAEACLLRADAGCGRVVRKGGALHAAAVRRVAAQCTSGDPPTAIPLADFVDGTTGLGFYDAAASCSVADGDPVDAAALLACVYRTLQCTAEGAVAGIVPRAYDLLGELDLDPDVAFPCVTDLESP